MTKSTVARFLIGSILIAAGIVWSIMFPKTMDLFKPDFVASVAIGTGLVLSGLIILFLKKNRIVSGILSLLLIWSVLMNLCLFSFAKCGVNAMKEIMKKESSGSLVVMKTIPQAFSNDIEPSLKAITATFNQTMMDKSWSWTGGGETYPKTTGEPSYDLNKTTCSLPVKLEPGKVYWVGINSPSYQNFKSEGGVPAKRYVILFATKDPNGNPTPIPDNLLAQAKAINGQ